MHRYVVCKRHVRISNNYIVRECTIKVVRDQIICQTKGYCSDSVDSLALAVKLTGASLGNAITCHGTVFPSLQPQSRPVLSPGAGTPDAAADRVAFLRHTSRASAVSVFHSTVPDGCPAARPPRLESSCSVGRSGSCRAVPACQHVRCAPAHPLPPAGESDADPYLGSQYAELIAILPSSRSSLPRSVF